MILCFPWDVLTLHYKLFHLKMLNLTDMDSSALKITDDVFSSEEKILGLLVNVRNAALPAEEKAAIRDMILDYAGNTDEAKRNELKEAIKRRLPSSTTETKVVENTPKAKTETKAVSIGRPRPVLNFKTTTNSSFVNNPAHIVQEEIKPVASPTPVTPVVKVEEKIPEPVKQKPAEPVEMKAADPVVPKVTPPPVAPEVKDDKIDVPTPKAEDLAPAGVVNQSAKGRINEIKHEINDRVGNPINLINADETIGREYMTSLLNAMKAVNSGAGPQSEPMNRLEAAYKKVNELLATKDVSLSKKIKVSSVTPEPKPTVALKNPETQTSPIMSGLPSREHGGGTNIPKVETVSPLTTPVRAPEPAKVEIERPDVTEPVDKLIPVSTATSLPEKIETARQKSIEREAEASRPVSSLEDEKVTAGLKQLLSEWKLFKGKSWFGGGASGMDHPMYKQLANLTMAAVISGRYEGATPETKYLISDYINGWRYEQGITYEVGETFEHYLRRVILQILSNQKAAAPAATKKP